MDCEASDFRVLDVARRVSGVSFCYFTSAEVEALSVAEISVAAAFDDLGRPHPGGLYDPRLGPKSHEAGACVTCGLGYAKCPGHYGHIRLPIPLVHPHLRVRLYKLLKAACWECGRIKHVERRKRLLLARLRFEHVGDKAAADFVMGYSYSVLDSHGWRGRPGEGGTANDMADALRLGREAVSKLVAGAPPRIRQALDGVDAEELNAMDEALVASAELAWNEADAAGSLVEPPGARYEEAVQAAFDGAEGNSKCPLCNAKKTLFARGENGSFFFGKRNAPSAFLGPLELAEQVERIWAGDRDLMELVYGLKGRAVRRGLPPIDHNMFFVQNMLVTPSRFRPAASFGDSGLEAEHPQNIFYQRMLTTMEAMVALREETSAAAAEGGEAVKRNVSVKAESAKLVAEMQKSILELYDSPGGDVLRNGGAVGIRQQLESKQGLFRMHMMGKRVNFSCRSVIGPDVFLDTNEVGIPESFAKLLTVAESVTPRNLAEMQAAVLNGPDVYPGANAVEDWGRSGKLTITKFRSSKNKKLLDREAKLLVRSTRDCSEENGDGEGEGRTDGGAGSILPKRVLRHLKTGDIVLFNRQPTLHRVSMMAHKVRVLPGDRTIRFHYANCRSYNADFDGDEMNIHVPQDDVARAEARTLMLSDRHYIAPTSGEPIRDLIQDHILAAALISQRGTYFERDVFCRMLYSATERIMSKTVFDGEKRFSLPRPAILKPRSLWTGKQLLSAVLDTVRGDRPGINLEGSTRVKSDLVGKEESNVLFLGGQLLRGVLDKNSFGASRFGIVHAVQEAYGSQAAGDFLSAIGRLCTFFIRAHGHTTGVDDLMIVRGAESARLKELLSGVNSIGIDTVREVKKTFAGEDGGTDDDGDAVMTDKDESDSAKQSAARKVLTDLVRSKGVVAEARLDSTISTKLNALASTVNRCIPSGLGKKYPRNGFSLMTDTGAKGSAVNSRQISCLLGPTIMEGKRVPRIGGSGATLPCFAPYDPSPNAGGFIASRFLTGIAPYEVFFHAMAGREGLLDTSLKTANSGYLQRCLVKHLEGVRLHYDYTVRDSNGTVLQMVYGDDGIDPCKASWLMNRIPWQLRNKDLLNLEQPDRVARKPRMPSERIRALQKEASKPGSGVNVVESMSPGAFADFGVVSEAFEHKIDRATSHHSVGEKDRPGIDSFLRHRYQRAVAEPGDGVGVIAAQSVGEPSTQMTLNTFHHAGSESKHVTLGVPRLRELLMTAAKYPKTPTMTLPLLDGLGDSSAKTLSRRFANVSLVDLVEKVSVKEGGVSFQPDLGDIAVHLYRIDVIFPAERVYAEEVGFGFARILNAVKIHLVKNLYVQFEKEVKKINVDGATAISKSTATTQTADVEDTAEALPFENTEALVEAADSEGGEKSGDEGEEIDDGDFAEKDQDDDGDDSSSAASSRSDDEQTVPMAPGSAETEATGENGNAQAEESQEEEKIRLWKEAKRAQLKADKMKASPKKKKPVKRKPRANAEKVAPEANGDIGDDYGDEESLTGSMGLAGKVVGCNDSRTIQIPWVLPQEVNGRLRVAELVREAASTIKLASTDRITRCFTEDVTIGNSKRLAIATEGSNLEAALELGDGLVDMDRVMTNDMFGILEKYGVEALRSALIAEFQKIFGAYGIPVNTRHLSLIADYQCALGGYRAFNRSSMQSAASTIQQFSFETTMKFLTEAALNGRVDGVLQAPSASIATGELYTGGTGCFEVLSHVQ